MKLKWLSLVLITLSLPAIAQQSLQPPEAQKPSGEFLNLQRAAGSSIFIYDANSKPCEAPPPGLTLLPLGSGFVIGIPLKSQPATPEVWRGWKFLITAKHVIGNRQSIILRLNLKDKPEFTCYPLSLTADEKARNVLPAPSGIDLVAIVMPDIPDTDPTVVDESMLLDQEKMKGWNIGVGTEIFTVGYLFGYSGQKANFPVTKFGEISVVTDEKWYENPDSHLAEQGYVVEVPNAPGLSGAPILTHGFEFDTNPFRYRELPPYVVGVVKGLMLVPVNGALISQGVAIVEPAANLRALISQIATLLKNQGADVTLPQ